MFTLRFGVFNLGILPQIICIEKQASGEVSSIARQWEELARIDFREQWRLKFESKGLQLQLEII